MYDQSRAISLSAALTRVEALHATQEPKLPQHKWADWYAVCLLMLDERASDEQAMQAANDYVTKKTA